jgi:hypothetical protein
MVPELEAEAELDYGKGREGFRRKG